MDICESGLWRISSLTLKICFGYRPISGANFSHDIFFFRIRCHLCVDWGVEIFWICFTMLVSNCGHNVLVAFFVVYERLCGNGFISFLCSACNVTMFLPKLIVVLRIWLRIQVTHVFLILNCYLYDLNWILTSS